MKKTIFVIIIFYISLCTLCSCELIRKPLDRKVGFSNNLKEVENYIQNKDWQSALSSLENADRAWNKIKPILQIDVDHDYVNVIENNFVLLKAYVESKEKPDALAIIRLIQEDWKNIGSM
jgi:hypothetical protein